LSRTHLLTLQWLDFDVKFLKTLVIKQEISFWGTERWPATFMGSNSPKNRHTYAKERSFHAWSRRQWRM